jgi:protein tyrosine/serine phosphatase
MTKLIRLYFAALAVVVGLSISSLYAQTSPSAINGITVKNFGQMDEHYYRGGQPKEKEYKSLQDLGINTIVDLRNDPEEYEKPSAEALGMKYINIPMDDAEYPSDATIAKFLEVINDPANGNMFVHCKGGKHRAGVTAAVYRMTKYGWDYDRAFTEMENYKFDTSWGRKVMKTFVQDYAAKMKTQAATAATSSAN